ncbi:MAG: sigma-70 family RNA polymerase sigma factor [Verrucomicrobiales bacterium]|nr:sigma-70 family RNA polymerase sigma factor [Verrucomicrobiales bacterium]
MEPNDPELLRRYVRNQDEDAFSLLVRRHIDLVYATAVRSLGGSNAASDVTQEVFLSLARKAAWLGAEGSLAGWLHRAAVLAARQRVRTEARRMRRDHVAALAHAMDSLEPESLPLNQDLDEALLELNDGDRRILVLRFLEQRSLREVGACLRIGEDAAQKRVAKALANLSHRLARRGYAAATAAGLAGSIQAAVIPAPPGLAAAVASHTFHAAAASAGGLSWTLAASLITPLMALTHVQTAALCLVTAALPLGYQWHARTTVRAEQQQLQANFHQARTGLYEEKFRRAHQQRRVESADRSLQWARKDLALRDEAMTTDTSTQVAATRYAWLDQSPYVRVPKTVLEEVHFLASTEGRDHGMPAAADPVSAEGTVSESLADTLDLTDADRAAVRESFAAMSSQFRQLEAEHVRVVTEGPPREFNVGNLDSATVILGAFPEAGSQLASDLQAQITRVLGEDKAAVLWAQSKEVIRSTFREFGALEEVHTLARDDRGGFSMWNGLRHPREARFESWGNSSGHVDLGAYSEPVRSHFQRWLEKLPSPAPVSPPSPQP